MNESFSLEDVTPRRAPWLWLTGPYIIVLVAFLALPLGNLGVLSVKTYSPVHLWTNELTDANYLKLLDDYYFGLIMRTLRIGGVTTVLCILLGYPIAYYLARCSQRVLAIGLFLIVMPLMVSSVIQAFGWIAILGRNGIFNIALKAAGIQSGIQLLGTETAVTIALTQMSLPLMVLPVMASIEKVSIRLEESAVNLGATPWQMARRVILPLSAPGLISGIILCFTVSISSVVTPAILGGRHGRMFGNEIYDQVVPGLNWPVASSLSIVLIVLIFAIVGGGLALSRRAVRQRIDS
jgi:ABC-type spermidine/putrescine transport system permease subunit I